MAGLNHWLSVARSPDADDVREHILSGYKDGKPFTPYVPTFALPLPVDRVLDFGCGLGRNFSYLKTIARHITGFDLPPMIERCRTMAGDGVEVLSDDWNDLRENRFDLIFAALVLQHIEPEACRLYLMDFLRMAPAVYLLTRADSDFGTNVIDLIAQTGMFEAGDCVRSTTIPTPTSSASLDAARSTPAARQRTATSRSFCARRSFTHRASPEDVSVPEPSLAARVIAVRATRLSAEG